MTLKALTIVVLRLLAISYFADALATTLSFASTPNLDFNWLFRASIYPVGILIVAVVLWLVARYLATIATKGIDGPLPFSALTREDIYCCAFVILGLYFVLSSIGATFTELYQFIQMLAEDANLANSQNKFMIPLVRHVLTLIAGLACILGAKAWTRKLLRLEQKNGT